MTRQIFVGLVTEGTTDERFLESIVRKTFEDIAFECQGDFEIELTIVKVLKYRFVNDVMTAAKIGVQNYGIMVLCVHADADNDSDERAFNDRINPAIRAVLNSHDHDLCKLIVALVPVQMTESWMLADISLLKAEIGTNLSDFDLGLHRNPESIADPKHAITEAIRLCRANMRRRRRQDLTISDLYLPLGQKINLRRLEGLPSYTKFRTAVRQAFVDLNYLH